MKKLLLFFLAAALALPLCACKEKIPEDLFSDMHADWDDYETPEELIKAATYVFEGKITNISFELIDLANRKTPPKVPDESYMLFTVCEVEVTNLYKGNDAEKILLAVEGGLSYYKPDEQYRLLKDFGYFEIHPWIPCLPDIEPLCEGKSYMFCTFCAYDPAYYTSKFEHILNPHKSITQLDSELAKEIREYFEKD